MNNIINIAGEQLLVSVLLYVIYKLSFEKETLFIQNRIYLLGSVIIILTVPFLSFELIPNYVYLDQQPMSSVPVSVSKPVTNRVGIAPIQAQVNYPLLILQSVYVLGFLMMLFRLGSQLVTVYRLHKRSRHLVLDNIPFCINQHIEAPFSFFNRIYSSDSKLPTEVIEHEKVHIAQHHTIDNIILEICKALMWYNPFIYLLHRRLKEVHEYTCDSITAQKINNLPAYAQFLLEFNSKGTTPVIVNSFHSQIKKRLMMLKNANDSNSSKLKNFLFIPILLFFFLGFTTESYSVVKVVDKYSGLSILDSIPLSENMVVDTAVLFDENTFEETIYYLRTKEGNSYNVDNIFNHDGKGLEDLGNKVRRDTAVMYNETTHEEEIKIFEDVQNECYEIKWKENYLAYSVIDRTQLSSLLNSNIEIETSGEDCKAFSNYNYNVYLKMDDKNWEILDRKLFEENKENVNSVSDKIQLIIISDIQLQYENESSYDTPLTLEYHVKIKS